MGDDKIKEFLAVESGYGYGYGYGSGSGHGSGSGYGYGYGSGSGYGSGHGYGYGYGYGDGSGSGYGYGYGSGYGSGDGSGDGSGYGSGYGSGGEDVISLNEKTVHCIDGIPTIILAVHGNIARGEVVKTDLTTEKCYVAKGAGMFAHGETIRQATEALENKLFEKMPTEERIEQFIRTFNVSEEYPVKAFYDWHNKLTGSCEMGRKMFAEQNGIDIENGKMTVEEFIDLTRDAFGGTVIRQLEQKYLSNKK